LQSLSRDFSQTSFQKLNSQVPLCRWRPQHCFQQKLPGLAAGEKTVQRVFESFYCLREFFRGSSDLITFNLARVFLQSFSQVEEMCREIGVVHFVESKWFRTF
jgi:hypothetical protein